MWARLSRPGPGFRHRVGGGLPAGDRAEHIQRDADAVDRRGFVPQDPADRGARVAAVLAISGVLLACALLARGNGIALLSTFLVLLLYFLVPWTAVNLVDYFLVRKGRYAIPHFFTPKGIYGAWQARGIAAYLIGFASMVPFFHIVDAASGQAIFGYVAQRMHGVDIAWLVGLLVAGSVTSRWSFHRPARGRSASSRASATATWRRWPNTSRRSSNERASHPSDPVDPGRWRRRRPESGARPHRAVRRSGGSGGLLRNIHPGFPTPQNVARLAEPLDGPSLSALRDAARQASAWRSGWPNATASVSQYRRADRSRAGCFSATARRTFMSPTWGVQARRRVSRMPLERHPRPADLLRHRIPRDRAHAGEQGR